MISTGSIWCARPTGQKFEALQHRDGEQSPSYRAAQGSSDLRFRGGTVKTKASCLRPPSSPSPRSFTFSVFSDLDIRNQTAGCLALRNFNNQINAKRHEIAVFVPPPPATLVLRQAAACRREVRIIITLWRLCNKLQAFVLYFVADLLRSIHLLEILCDHDQTMGNSPLKFSRLTLSKAAVTLACNHPPYPSLWQAERTVAHANKQLGRTISNSDL